MSGASAKAGDCVAVELYRFGPFELDRGAYQLRSEGRDVRLERIPLDVLFLLVERSGRLVLREEILEHVWGKDVFVDVDTSINTAVRKIRQALKDDPDSPKFLATVPSKGYRFVAPVDKFDTATPAAASAIERLEPLASSEGRVWSGGWKILLAATLTLAIALMVFFRLRQQHALTEEDTIVLADFTNTTGDVIFDDTLREGLAVQLAQSPFLTQISDEEVQRILRMMKQPADSRLTPQIAREICHRANGTAVLDSSIGQIGSRYNLIVKAVNCSSGETLASTEVQAGDKNHILDALGRAASDIRKRLGESLATIRKFDSPLVQATTSSLDALKAYSLGVAKFDSGDLANAIPLFQRSIELDPLFAMAHADLGRSYQVLGQYERMEEQVRKAFELRDRVSEREKFEITAGFHQFVTNQILQTVQTCELWEQSYPRDFTPHRILGFENGALARYERSAEEFRKAMELDPNQALPYAGLINDYSALDRFAEAHAVYQQAQARRLDAREVQRQRYKLAFVEGDAEMMTRLGVALSAEPGFESEVSSEESHTAGYFGHLARARELSSRSENDALRDNDPGTAARIVGEEAVREALFGNRGRARARAIEAVKLGGQPAMAFALAGDAADAKVEVDKIASHTPSGSFLGQVFVPEFRGAIELGRGNAARALDLLAPAAPYEAGWFDLYMAAYLRGEAYLLAHRGQEAAVEFQKIISHRGIVANSEIGALAHLGIGRAYAMQADFPRARVAYQDFLALWKDADTEIPILKEAKAEYAKLPLSVQ
jgi:DNA-binding winged helix-turn-helix (wHTH) protein/Flp pilus assembly protein TadD